MTFDRKAVLPLVGFHPSMVVSLEKLFLSGCSTLVLSHLSQN